MSVPTTELCVVDTCVLVHLIRQNATGQMIEEQYGLSGRTEKPLLSSIVEGELRALARVWGWGDRKVGALELLLDELVRVDAGLPEVVHQYARLYAECRRAGALPGENDLWLAATTRAVGGVLYTCDSDFLWFHPDHIHVCHIATL